MRRFRTVCGDFDTRCRLLDPIQEDWEESVKHVHRENRSRIIAGLKAEFGSLDLDRKVADFIAIEAKPFSVLSYHNAFFGQTRDAFVQGAYYPALLSASALGERTLNHLVIDLRDHYKDTPEYQIVHGAKSFPNWKTMIDTLAAWSVLDQEVSGLFRKLSGLRHRAVHFNPSTYATVRDDALAAIIILREIIEKQFGAFGRQRWYIEGTLGACFIKRAYESDPFVKRFIAPRSTYVGPLHAVRMESPGTMQFVDWPPEVYGASEITDEQYKTAFNSRDPAALASTDGPFVPATILGPDDVPR